MTGLCRLAAAALAALLVNVAAAHADAVDGPWCYKDGRRLHVDGPNITIPSGKRITGDYHRHGFAYVVPLGEKGAGGRVVGSQLSDDVLHVTPQGGGLEIWGRCKKGVS